MLKFRRQYVVYACVSFMSFNMTVVMVTLFYTPKNTASSAQQRRHFEPVEDPDNNNNNDDDSDRQLPPQLVPVAPETNRHNFRLPNRLIGEYDMDVAARIKSLAERRVGSRDPELIRLAADLIDPPPTNEAGYKMFKVDKTPQVAEVENVLGETTGGFFVECGGLDGERLSNTAFLERERKWQGLLIEMDPFFYTQLLGKNRRVSSINACLSPYKHFTTLPYAGDTRGRGQLVVKDDDPRIRTHKADRLKVVPCFPFETILLALNRTRVNYFSLDIEGFELPVLKSIDWQHIEIQVLSVEFNRGKDKTEYAEYMESQGYRTFKEVHSGSFFAHDFIFVLEKIYQAMDNADDANERQEQQKQKRKQPAKPRKPNKQKQKQEEKQEDYDLIM